jgi:hypothetical protein
MDEINQRQFKYVKKNTVFMEQGLKITMKPNGPPD